MDRCSLNIKKMIIIKTAEPLPSMQGNVISGGILRVDKAVQAALSQAQPPTSRKLLQTV